MDEEAWKHDARKVHALSHEPDALATVQQMAYDDPRAQVSFSSHVS